MIWLWVFATVFAYIAIGNGTLFVLHNKWLMDRYDNLIRKTGARVSSWTPRADPDGSGDWFAVVLWPVVATFFIIATPIFVLIALFGRSSLRKLFIWL